MNIKEEKEMNLEIEFRDNDGTEASVNATSDSLDVIRENDPTATWWDDEK